MTLFKLWNNENLLDQRRVPLPSTYLCYLVRKMYSADEIKDKVPQLSPKDGDVRPQKIKGIFLSHKVVRDIILFRKL